MHKSRNQCSYGYGCKCSCQSGNDLQMLSGNIGDNNDCNNNVCSSLLIDEQGDVEIDYLRKKLHASREENVLLREEMAGIKRVVTKLQEENTLLRSSSHTKLAQSQQYTQFLQQKLTTFSSQLQQHQLTIQNHTRFVYNLNQQNELLIGINRMLSEQNAKLRKNYQCVFTGYEGKKEEIARLTREVDVLCGEVVGLERVMGVKGVLQHQLQLQTPMYLLEEEADKKLAKYKQKAVRYKQQRNQLLQQIQQAKQQIGHITLRRCHED